jgi:site-specific DNA recombinase
VREVFHRRGHGQSLHQIARWLNELGVPLQRVSKRADGGYWRAARVSNILRNPIYRGEFLWNASATIRARAKKSGRELKVESFARPQLRLVADELWYRCNDNIISRSGYGGGKHALAGLVTCGDCGSVLVLSSQSRCRSLYCANCTAAKAMGVQPQAQTATVATAGVEKLLRTALQAFLTPVFISTFRAKLQNKLSGNPRDDIQKQERELARHKSAQERFSHMLWATEQDDPVLMARYEESREKVRSIGVRLQALSSVGAEVNQDVINAQMQVDPGVLLDSVFESAIAPERLRALLARLFPEIVFEGKPDGRYTSTFRIRFAVGQALALASETDCLLSDTSQVRYQLSYHPRRKGPHEPGWSVQALADGPDSLAAASVGEQLALLPAPTGQGVPAQMV